MAAEFKDSFQNTAQLAANTQILHSYFLYLLHRISLRDKMSMSVAINAFYAAVQEMGNVLAVPAWERGCHNPQAVRC